APPPTNGTAARGSVMQATGGYYCSNCPTGRTCNNGCGSLNSDAGFVLGSCKKFFDPCGPQGLCEGHKDGHKGGHGGCGTGDCGTGGCGTGGCGLSGFGPAGPGPRGRGAR